ncbi:MAG: Stk1 family PASTA domain-containing Ser/Thr kinase [Clostridium sp.]|nr:Stk1 family PASTA domain-containing Ser/Thr kinase [Clostridium sp.]
MIGQILGNRYEILEKIGEGGMSEVYKARCNKLNRFVAVKILKESLASNEEIVEKFKKEATAIAALSDNNIVNVLDVGSQDNINYIVMELVKGKTLKELIVEFGKMNYETAIKIAIQVAKALDCAHKNGIIHRDVKPQNILVTEDGIIKVTDFGIAKSSGSGTLTNSSTVMGSAHYFSPEQAKGSFLDARTDLYSLGVVIYEMTTGRLPFDAESPVTVALKHIQEEPIPPKQINSKIPESLNNLILKAMSKEPSKRYQTAKELINDLQKIKDDPNVKIGANPKEDDGHTIIMSAVNPDEINNIKNSTSNNYNNYDNENYDSYDNDYDDENDDDYDDDYYDDDDDDEYEDYYDDDYDDDDYDDDNYHRGRKKENKSKKIIITIVSILAICLIGVVGYNALGNSTSESSESNNEVNVPPIEGMTIEQAKTELSKAQLKLVEGGTEESDKPEGTIISVYPKVGTSVKIKTEVRVIVSGGQTKIKMPDLTESTLDDAKALLAESDLNNYEIIEQYSNSIPSGEVIGTEPEAGKEVSNDTAIKIYISKGKEIKYVTVEDVIGMSENRAKSTLEKSGLTVADVQTVKVKDDSNVNVVVKQSIEPGKSVQAGTSITIYIGYKEEEKEQSVDLRVVIGMQGSEAIQYLVNLGFSRSNIALDGTGNRNDVVENVSSKYAKPSEAITLYTEKVSSPSEGTGNGNEGGNNPPKNDDEGDQNPETTTVDNN